MLATLAGAAAGTLSNRGCAHSQGKLSLPTPTKSIRAHRITELGYFLYSSSGARAWHKQTRWQVEGWSFRGKRFGWAGSCYILAPPHPFCIVSVLTICYGLQQHSTKQFPSPAAGRTHSRQCCSFLITICLWCEGKVTESARDRAGDDRRAIGNEWPCPTEGHSQQQWEGWLWMSAWIKGTTRGDSQARQGSLNLPFFYRPKNDTPSPLLPLFLLHQCPLDAILPNSFWQNKRKRSQQLTSPSTWSCLKQCTFRSSKINYFNFSFPSLNSRVMTKNISTVAILQDASRLAKLGSMRTWRFVLRVKHLKYVYTEPTVLLQVIATTNNMKHICH